MSLTENALRKLQRDGRFAAGPATEPLADSQQSPTATVPLAAGEATHDGAASGSEAPQPSAATESPPTDDASAASLPPLPDPVTESPPAEPHPQPDAPAYDPVIRPFEDAAPELPSESEAKPQDDGSAPVDMTQPMDEVDLRRRSMEEYAAPLPVEPSGREVNPPDKSAASPDVTQQMDEVDLRRRSMEGYAPALPSECEVKPRDESPAPVDMTQPMDEADLSRLSREMGSSQVAHPPVPDRLEAETAVPEHANASAVPDDPTPLGSPDTFPDQAADEAACVEELTATEVEKTAVDSQETTDAEESLVVPTAKVAAASSVPYEQLVLERLSQPDYAQPFLRLQQALLERCGSHLPASLLTVSPQATARSAELVVHLSLLWAAADEEILLVDANLEEQTLTRQLEALGHPGLCDILAGTCSPVDLVRSTSQNRVHFVPCGDDMVGISRDLQQLDPLLLQRLLEHWCRQYHRVLIDVGSIGASLALPLAEVCEASLLVVCMQGIELPQIDSAVKTLLNNDRPVLGCVLTDLPR